MPETTPLRLALVAAIADNSVIGVNGALPWRIAADLKKFRALTIGHAVVMGRRTWESLLASPLAGPLPQRRNVIVSSQATVAVSPAPATTQIAVVRSFGEAITDARSAGATTLFAIGGARIYAAALAEPLLTDLYLTHVEGEPAGDVFFPAWDKQAWKCVAEEALPDPVHHARFCHYQRA